MAVSWYSRSILIDEREVRSFGSGGVLLRRICMKMTERQRKRLMRKKKRLAKKKAKRMRKLEKKWEKKSLKYFKLAQLVIGALLIWKKK